MNAAAEAYKEARYEIASLRKAMERIIIEAEVLAANCPPPPHACHACEILFVAKEATER